MTTAGFLVMFLSVGIVTILLISCVYRVMTQPREEVEHLAGVELHTPDMDEGD
jgi:hypothetical protein